jgi:hypothetical protein
MAYAWQAISDDERHHVIDSVNTLRKRTFDSTVAKRAADSAAGKPQMTRMVSIGADGGITTERMIPAPAPRPPKYAELSEIPDYRPPTGKTAIVADHDNNVWIAPIPAKADSAGTVWEVYSRKGTLVDRVLIPAGRSILGFGADGTVYLGWRDAGVTLVAKVGLR